MSPTGKARILCCGHDPVLNRTRRLIFEKDFDVSVAQNIPEAETLLANRHFALLLLCYSLTDDECRILASLRDQHGPETRILALLHEPEGMALKALDAIFLSGGPAELRKKAAATAGITIEPDEAFPPRV